MSCRFVLLLTMISLPLFSQAQNDELEPVVAIEEVIIVDENSEAYEYQVPSEEELKGMREMMGIKDVPDDETKAYKEFSFRDEGSFIISKNKFTQNREAKSFCDAQERFELINNQFTLLATMMGLPFRSLHETSIITHPVINFEGMRTGVAFWVNLELEQIPVDQIEDFFKAYPHVKSGDFVATLTDGNGAGAGALEQLSALNSRLVELGEEPLAMPAVCIDQDLKNTLL